MMLGRHARATAGSQADLLGVTRLCRQHQSGGRAFRPLRHAGVRIPLRAPWEERLKDKVDPHRLSVRIERDESDKNLGTHCRR